MLLPSLFSDRLFDDFMDFPFRGLSVSTSDMMKTDIKDTGSGYELDIDMPGFKKEDIKAELKDGYLTIAASTSNEETEKDNSGKYIRKERYAGSCSRRFYIGENVKQDDIIAKFDNGILKLSIPKVERNAAVEEKKYIAIEG